MPTPQKLQYENPITGKVETIFNFATKERNDVPDFITCRVCGKEKSKKEFSVIGYQNSKTRRRNCKACYNKESSERNRALTAEIAACRAAGDGYDTKEGRLIPEEILLFLHTVRVAVRHAKYNGTAKGPLERDVIQRIESILWLLTFDVVDVGIGPENMPQFTFGYMRMMLDEYGIYMPNDEKIKAKLTEWAANARFHIMWEAMPVTKGFRYHGLDKKDKANPIRGSSPLRRFADSVW